MPFQSVMRSRCAGPVLAHIVAGSCVVWLNAAAVADVTAPHPPPPQAVRLTVEPAEAVLSGPLDRLQIVATGRNSQGHGFDLTRAVEYDVASPDVLAVDGRGRVRPRSQGTGVVRVRYGDQTAEVRVSVGRAARDRAVGFRRDVIPVLSKAGCNQGACHASQYGKGGFKLSLLGFAPEQDHPALARERLQRRVSVVRPKDSLILRKATMQLAHGGGKRFEKNSYPFDVLKTWIEAGLPGPRADEPKVVELSIFPLEGSYRVGECQQLRVVAHYSDGAVRDVTGTALYDSQGEGVATVEPDGYLAAVGNGQTTVMVRYMGQAKVSRVIVPFAEKVDLAGFECNNFIDEHVKSRWQLLGVRSSPRCSDAEFIRRAFLDSIGTLPDKDRVTRFLDSDDPDKRTALVDELLGLTGDAGRDRYVEEWSAYWALKWGDLLRNNRNSVGDGGMWALYNWLRKAFRENMPIDEFARRIITAQGSIYNNGPANYYRIARKPADLAETTAQVFLGIRLQCARCHHHPYEVFSQKDYYSLAAFFTQVGTKGSVDFGVLGGDQVVKLNASGRIKHPRTGEVMRPTPLLEEPIESEGLRDLRRPLAEWITSPDNDLFARNIANRVWGYFMGTGLVEPVDDMRATNPPSNPELLDALADYLVDSGYNLRALMRAIMTSQVYQLSSRPRAENADEMRLYLHFNLKRLPAEVLLDAIDFACGTQERFRGVPIGTRAVELPDPNYQSYFLDTLGRPARAVACECERTAEPNLAQVLHIANGELVNRKLAAKDGRVARLVEEHADERAAITELYLVTASRRPNDDEVQRCREIIEGAESRQEGLQDILWALLNSREFLFNH